MSLKQMEAGGNVGGMVKKVECEEFEIELDGKMETFNHRAIWIRLGQEVEDAAADFGIELVGDNAVAKHGVDI